MEVFHTIWWCFCLLTCAYCIPQTLLYEYANSESLQLPKGDEISSPRIQLQIPIVFYGVPYNSIYVNSNGLLTFQTEFSSFLNSEFPLPDPLIAPFYSNVDTSQAGTIWYHQTNRTDLLERATETVQDSFSNAEEFQALSLFIATWEGVGYHLEGSDNVNTYQVVISSDGYDSYVEFIYPEGGLQWIQGTGDKDSGLPDARAQSGFVSSDGRHYTLPYSGTDQVRNLDKLTNMNVAGQWLFRIGLIDLDVNIEEPDRNNDAGLLTGPPTCSSAVTYCHSKATCKDYDGGICCKCKDYYYGNGKSCVRNNIPIRVNGKVNGKINGEKFEDLDLQSYVVLEGARAYTAISNVPNSIGFDIQSLQILGAVIAWLFAEPSGDALNGYQLTGGEFNHTATIFFTSTGQKINVRQKFLGLDVFDQLRLETDIQGDIPILPEDSQILISEYQERYTLTAPGIVQSSSSHFFTYNDNGQEITQLYRVEHSFIFNYCKFEQIPVGTTWRLKVGRNFIAFDKKEKIIRYGLSNKIGPLGDTDPCEAGRASCGENSACVVEGDSYRCVCNPGYQNTYHESGRACVDIDECQSGLQECDVNAECINEVGAYSCRCLPGFEGDGRSCKSTSTCQNVQCPENSQCIEDGYARCQCLEGFTGDGSRCYPVTSQSCDVNNNCSPYAVCTINQDTQQYYCVCLPEYEGDGYNCRPLEVQPSTTEYSGKLPKSCILDTCWCPTGYALDKDQEYCEPVQETSEYPVEATTPDDVHAYPEIECFNSTICFCPKGYVYNQNSSYCIPKTNITLESKGYSGYNISCAVLNNCNKEAQCVYSLATNSSQCVCNYGFEGDGYYCAPQSVSCAEANNCDVHATCTYFEDKGKYECVCNPGYDGDGYRCKIIATCTSNEECPENEECLYTGTSQQYECVCQEGLARDSQNQCVKHSCGGGTCVKNAECLFDEEYQTHYCSCKSDYVGDGITECVPRPIGCNVVNNCGLHAVCQYDRQLSLYQCKCEESFHGDGFVCYREENCHINPLLCDAQATCVASASRKYTCECNFGYTGNGTICKPNPRHEGNFLLLNQGIATFKIPYEPTKQNPGKVLHFKADQIAIGLDIDCLGGKIYWSDINGKVIRSSLYNGSSIEDFISHDIGSPEGLAVDWVSRNIYWTDSTRDTIEVANLETKLRKVLFNNQLVNPRGIAVHPQRGKIFWSDWDRRSPKIEWANADGSGRQIFLQGENVKLPNSLVIDFTSEQLCYADAGTKTIECVDIDSRIRHTIAVNCTYPFGIAVTDRYIYWSDWISKKIERVDKQTLTRQTPLQVPLGVSINKLYGLTAVPERCPSLTNVCQFYKDQCPSGHICLPNGGGSRSCVCGYKSESPLEKPLCNY